MICERCGEYKKILAIEKYMVLNGEYGEFLREFKLYSERNLEYEECENCEQLLTESQLIIENEEELLDILFEYISSIMSDKIENCESCSEQDEITQDIERKFNEVDEKEIRNSFSSFIPSGQDISEFIQEELEIELSEEELNTIAKNLVCRGCNHGSGPNYEDGRDYEYFSLYETIYTNKKNIEFDRKFYGDKIKDQISDLAEIITIEEIKELREDFKKSIHISNPKFNEVLNLFKSIRNGNNKNLEPVTVGSGKNVYHARKNKVSEPPLSEDKLWAPPFGCSGNGRYNQMGVSAFYASNSFNILSKELRKKNEERLTIGLFEIVGDKVLFPIDKLFIDLDYYGLISEIPEENLNNYPVKKEYILTNLIDFFARNSGYDGIIYCSVQDSSYLNYVFFDTEKIQLISTFEIVKCD